MPLTFEQWLVNLLDGDELDLTLKSYQLNQIPPGSKAAIYCWWFEVYLMWWENNPKEKEVDYLFIYSPYRLKDLT